MKNVEAFLSELHQVPKSNGPQYQEVTFNISCTRPNVTVYSSEIRFYKSKINSETINTLSSGLCQLNNGVVLLLLADLQGNGRDQVIEKVNLSRKRLMSDEWIVFRNFKSVYTQWKANHGNMENRVVKLVLQGGCASIHPSSIGLNITVSDNKEMKDPLMVVFVDTSPNSEAEQKMLQHIVQTVGTLSIEHKKRQIENTIVANSNGVSGEHDITNSCQLQKYTVST